MPWLILVFWRFCKRCFADANQYVRNVVNTILTKQVVKCQCLENFTTFSFFKKTKQKQSNNIAVWGSVEPQLEMSYAMSLIVAVKIQTWKCRATQQKSSFSEWFLIVFSLPLQVYKNYWTLKFPSSVISRAKSLAIGPFSSRVSSPSRISRVTYVPLVYSTFKHISLRASVQYFGIVSFPELKVKPRLFIPALNCKWSSSTCHKVYILLQFILQFSFFFESTKIYTLNRLNFGITGLLLYHLLY